MGRASSGGIIPKTRFKLNPVMDKTYAETQGATPFDWNAALNAAIEKEPTRQKRFELEEKASSWVTCACGNTCAIIPRSRYKYTNDAPVDVELLELGLWFNTSVVNQNWNKAKVILQQIELRADVLIKEELQKLNVPLPSSRNDPF